MESTPQSAPISKAAIWTSYAMSAAPVLMLLMSGVMKIMKTEEVMKGFADWPAGSAVTVGVLEIACTFIYLIPRTAVLGAILLVGYLGGAVSFTVKMGMGVAGWWMPVTFGVFVWGGLYLRDQRLRALLPFRR